MMSRMLHVRGTNSSIMSRNWRLFEATFQNRQHSVRARAVSSGISSYVDKIFFGRMPASRSNMLPPLSPCVAGAERRVRITATTLIKSQYFRRNCLLSIDSWLEVQKLYSIHPLANILQLNHNKPNSPIYHPSLMTWLDTCVAMTKESPATHSHASITTQCLRDTSKWTDYYEDLIRI